MKDDFLSLDTEVAKFKEWLEGNHIILSDESIVELAVSEYKKLFSKTHLGKIGKFLLYIPLYVLPVFLVLGVAGLLHVQLMLAVLFGFFLNFLHYELITRGGVTKKIMDEYRKNGHDPRAYAVNLFKNLFNVRMLLLSSTSLAIANTVVYFGALALAVWTGAVVASYGTMFGVALLFLLLALIAYGIEMFFLSKKRIKKLQERVGEL